MSSKDCSSLDCWSQWFIFHRLSYNICVFCITCKHSESAEQMIQLGVCDK